MYSIHTKRNETRGKREIEKQQQQQTLNKPECKADVLETMISMYRSLSHYTCVHINKFFQEILLFYSCLCICFGV